MPSVVTTEFYKHPKLDGVKIFPLDGKASRRGENQRVLVTLEPNVEIPLHSHSVNAEMFIVSGSGKVLSDDNTNGTTVKTGAMVYFEADNRHGFRAERDGMSFISSNGGIVDFAPQHWDITF